jgi:ABC-type sugar transport system substrate-binding protein
MLRTVIRDAEAKGPYFVSCRAGAEEAARARRRSDLGRSTSLDAAKQNELIDNWITRKVDAIAVAVENRAGISTVLREARERGIRVLTWDATPARRPRLLSQPGAAEDRQRVDRRGLAAAGRQKANSPSSPAR